MRPVYSCTMEGAVVCFTGFKDKEELVSQVTITLKVTFGLESIWFAVYTCLLCIIRICTYIHTYILMYICTWCISMYVVCLSWTCCYTHVCSLYPCAFVLHQAEAESNFADGTCSGVLSLYVH